MNVTMSPLSSRSNATGQARSLAARLRHEVVWVIIAVLFCLVEGLVVVTAIRPAKFFARGPVNPRSKPPLRGAPAPSRAG